MISEAMLFAAMIALLAGCATGRKHRPLYIDATFDPQQVDTITVLQPADLRYDKSLKTDFVHILGNYSKRVFKDRKYKVELNMDPLLVSGISEERLENPSSDWIRTLGPSDANWIMVLSIEYVSRFLSADSEAVAEVRGVLFDKSSGSVVWRGVGKGFEHAGILFGGLADNDAVRMALYNLSFSLPRKKDKISEYQNLSDPNIPLDYDKGKLPEKGMTKPEIQALFGEAKKVESDDRGETWYYHLNMDQAFVPFAANWYYPQVWVFHFDKDGRLLKFHFTDKRISPRDKE